MIRKVDVENGAPKIKDEVSKCLHCSDNHNKSVQYHLYIIVLLLSLLSSVLLLVLSSLPVVPHKAVAEVSE